MKKSEIIEYLDSIADTRSKWRKRGAYYHDQLEKYLRYLIPSQSRVLEIGCGTGELLAALNPERGVGIDISLKMVEIARRKFSHLEFEVGDFENIRLTERFDYVVIVETIGYVDDIQLAFKELKKVCKPETRVIIVYYNYLWEPVLKISEILHLRMRRCLQHWLPVDEIANLLQLNDFEILKRGYRFLLPVYIPLVSAFFNRFLANLPFLWKLSLNEILIAHPRCIRKAREEITCSVIIPCRNEKGNVENAVLRMPDMGKRTEIIFVEGHSKDGTFEACEGLKNRYPEKNISVLRQKGEGKYDAVRTGFEMARSDVLMILDADLTVPPEDLPKFFDAIASGKGDFINGTRLVYQMEKQAMRYLNLLANKFFSSAFSYILEQRIRDTLCGTKVLWRKDYLKIAEGREYFGDFDPFGDFDLLFGAAKLNLKIVEIPIKYRERSYGSTQISRFRHGFLLFKMVFFALGKIKFV